MSFEQTEFDTEPPVETKQWMCVTDVRKGFKNESHIVPVDDLWIHQLSADCTCHPGVEKIVAIETTFQVMHNAWDCREYHDHTAELLSRHRME